MTRYSTVFEKLKSKNEHAFVPFALIGDPNLSASYEIISTLIESGADAIELGFPFSDPIADGPTIQKASLRALANRVRSSDCFGIIKRLRESYPDIPIGLLLYSNLVFNCGIEEFYESAQQVGVDSILLADVPYREADVFLDSAKKYNLDQILIAPSNASDDTLEQISGHSSGYIYVLGRSGVTGTDVQAKTNDTEQLINKIKAKCTTPLLVGFGISEPIHLKKMIEIGADGAISGSSVVNIIEKNLDNQKQMIEQLRHYILDMKAATK